MGTSGKLWTANKYTSFVEKESCWFHVYTKTISKTWNTLNWNSWKRREEKRRQGRRSRGRRGSRDKIKKQQQQNASALVLPQTPNIRLLLTEATKLYTIMHILYIICTRVSECVAVWCYSITVNYPHTYTYMYSVHVWQAHSYIGTLALWHTITHFFYFFQSKAHRNSNGMYYPTKIKNHKRTYKETFLQNQCRLQIQYNTIPYIRWRVVFHEVIWLKEKKRSNTHTHTHTSLCTRKRVRMFIYCFVCYALMCICLVYALIFVSVSIIFIM